MSQLLRYLPCLFLLIALCSCSGDEAEVPSPCNSVYYWKSEFRVNATERQFLADHRVGKIYMRLFDVVRKNGQLMPNTTIVINDSVPADTEVIPVVFLAHDIMNDTTGLATLPQLLARRVAQMMDQNGLGTLRELQIDFDWTRRNEKRYFQLLADVRSYLPSGVCLSATIRLHQLALTPPPVDYGALMVYNVGNLKDYGERCSILTPQLVRPYLKYLPKYKLPLCTALPVYHWDLLFHKQQFVCIVRGVDLADTSCFMPAGEDRYRSISYQPIPPNGVTSLTDGRIFPNDMVRHEFVSTAMLDSVMDMLSSARASACRQVILYHLDSAQIAAYGEKDFRYLFGF